MARVLSAAAAAFDFPGALEAVVGEGERVVIERSGAPVAAIDSLADLEALRRLEAEADIAAARVAMAEGGEAIPYEELRRELGFA
jgi:PHD/YefM family antitoxin component YafN of YafNO toxin-antitoxin module